MNKYRKFLIIILISVLCEFIIFNYKSFITLFNKGTTYTNEEPGSSFVIDDIDKKVSNVKIEIDSEEYSKIQIFVKDEGNENYYLLNTKYVSSGNKRSLYQTIHTAGKVKGIRIDAPTDNPKITGITINPKVPIMFSFPRLIIIFIILSLIYVFTSPDYYKLGLFERRSNKVIILEVLLLICLVLGALCSKNRYFQQEDLINQRQYNYLTNSIKEGRIYVAEVTDPHLLNMKNPYDTMERSRIQIQENTRFLWDYSFYKNRYYVYFGIGPVLLTYLPYTLLTGHDMSNLLVNFIFIILSAFSITYLLYNICKKWFKDVKLLTFLMCLVLLISSSGVFYVSKRPDFYNIPIIISLFFITLGLGLFISASISKKLFKTKLVLASSCMAFVALCRPQFLISSFLIVPLYYDYFFKKFDKQKFKELLCIIIPYVVFAILTCTYNYIRFGNIFDFGVAYNLTTNDMTKRGFVLSRIPLGIFYYLLIPARFVPYFPFIDSIPALSNTYFGITIYENTFGGFFFTHAITVLSLFVTKLKKYFKDKNLYYLCILSIIFAFVVVIVDTEMAGILARYYMDFSYLLLIPTVIIVFVLEKYILKNKILKQILIILISIAVIYEVLLLLVDSAPAIRDNIKDVYYYFYYLFNI